MGKKKENPAQQVINQANQQYQTTLTPSPLENQMSGVSQQFMNNYNTAVQRNTQDYGDIMGAYNQFRQGLTTPRISAPRPAELGESYGYLREAMPGYREFASTGGYSPTDIQELRARGISPIRAAYGNTMMELDRSRALGGSGGQGQYVAALSRAQRELPEQLANATTNVNAGLADAIRQGRMFGLQGISGTGATMGGLSSQEAGRQLQAEMSNQQAEQNSNQMRLAALGGMSSLYGTTPGMSSMFGNQALNSYGQLAGMQAARQNYGLGLMDTQLRGYNTQEQNKGTPWWQTALGIAGTVAPYVAMASDRNIKKDIKPIRGGVNEKLRNLPIYTWKYKGEKVSHLGPIAQEFKKMFGIGDGKTLMPVDIMGVVLASQKEAVANG
jgi:Chaperone of endosialidase